MSRILAWCVTALWLLWPAVAVHGVEPHCWKFKENDRFFAELTFFKLERTRQVAQLTEGMEELKIVCRFTVLKAEADQIVLEQQFVHVNSRGMGANNSSGVSIFRGGLLQLTLDKNLQVERIEGIEPLLAMLPGGVPLPQQKMVLEGLENQVRSWLQEIFVPLPSKALTVGETWTDKTRRKSAIFGWEKTYACQRNVNTETDRLARVEVRGKAFLSEEELEKKHVKDAACTGTDFRETLSFDVKQGRLVRGTSRTQIEFQGAVEIVPEGRSARVQTEIILLTTLGISTSNPLDAKPEPSVKTVSHEQEQPGNHAKEWTNSLGMKLVMVPAGKCTLGGKTSGQQEAEPTLDVEITRSFHMGAHEVTIGQYRKFVQETGYKTEAERKGRGIGFDKVSGKLLAHPNFSWKNPGWEVDDRHPVVNLSWEDAKEFCLWLSKKEGKNYRLPTEAEWEYACRAGSKSAYYCGDEPETLANFANVVDVAAKKIFPQWQAHRGDDGHVFTSPVGSFKPNAFGLHDMHGNALEWCEDWYFHYPRGAVVDPQGPSMGILKVQRGGSFADFPQQCTSAYRMGFLPDSFCVSSGFRVVLAEGPVSSFARNYSWVGQTVMPRDPEVLSPFGKNNIRPTPNPVMFVLQERFGVLRVVHNGREIVLPKDELVPIDQAIAIYTEQLQETVLSQIYFLRATGLSYLGKNEEALRDLSEAIQLDDENAWLYMTRATLYQRTKQYAAALKDLTRAVDLKEDNYWVQNALSWMLSTCTEKSVRDGKKAIEHGERARELTKGRDGNILDTLAAAYAEDGQFDEAVRWQNAALKDAAFVLGFGDVARERLKLYESKTPYREDE